MVWRMMTAALLAATLFGPPRAEAADGPRWGGAYVPNVDVVAHDGRTLRFRDDAVKGKIVVLNFIYTSCSNICPIVIARLAQLQDGLRDVLGRSVFFVSVSIDPVHDTPERLRTFAEAFPVDPSWLFLTGDFNDVNVIRYKLGERTQALTQHRNDLLLFNDRTGDWQRASAFDDLELLALTIRAMDPEWRMRAGAAALSPDESAVQSETSAGSYSNRPSGQSLFMKLCVSCHSLGQGRRVGPDLAGLLERRDRDWVRSYVANPGAMRARKDPIALRLAQDHRVVKMPNIGLSNEDIDDLISFFTPSAP